MQDVVCSLGSASVYSTSCFFGESEEKKNRCESTFWGSIFTVFLFYSINVQPMKGKSTCSLSPGFLAAGLQGFDACQPPFMHAEQGVSSLHTLRGQTLKPPWHTVLWPSPTYSILYLRTSSRCVAMMLAQVRSVKFTLPRLWEFLTSLASFSLVNINTDTQMGKH